MVFKGDILINRDPKSTFAGFSVVRETEDGSKQQYAIPICCGYESLEDFRNWFDKTILARVGKLKLNGKVTFEDLADPNNAGDFIVKNNKVMIQPVLPIF